MPGIAAMAGLEVRVSKRTPIAKKLSNINILFLLKILRILYYCVFAVTPSFKDAFSITIFLRGYKVFMFCAVWTF